MDRYDSKVSHVLFCDQFFIALSCALAVFCNISQYLCIGRFSAVTFQVLGHMKTVCVLVLGWALFDSSLTAKNMVGMLMAILGMVIYSWAVEKAKRVDVSPSALFKESSLTEEDVALLVTSSGTEKTGIELGHGSLK